MSVVHIRDKDHFDTVLKEAGDNLVVVDFYATWCGPCKMISPELEKMASAEFTDVMFLKVDVDENEDISTEYNVSAMPTFIFFKNGKQVTHFSGANASKIREVIKENK